jgi:hypothetical protein
MTTTAEDRSLAERIARMVRAGDLDAASDLLADELDNAYRRGYRDGEWRAES